MVIAIHCKPLASPLDPLGSYRKMKRWRTRDDYETADGTRLRFFTTESLGETRALTPDGFLVCHDVAIARTGVMKYGPGEVPIATGADGLITIHRDEDEVFRPEYMASFNGKPVVNDHPPEDVRPDNWRKYAVGTVMNVRRGTGMQGDLLIADLIITDPQAIKDVQDGKIEVSCGYDADYEEIERGVGRQVNMVGNHVALVDAGRCGARCAIGDRNTLSPTGDHPMKTRDKKPSWLDRLLKAVKANDAEEIKAAAEEAEEAAAKDAEGSGGDTHVHIHAGTGGSGAPSGKVMGGNLDEDLEEGEPKKKMFDDETEARFASLENGHQQIMDTLSSIQEHLGLGQEDSEAEAALEGELAEEAPPAMKDAARKARDSAYMQESFQETVAAAEILVPGIRIPTFDKKLDPKKTLDTVCKFRRTALDLAYAQPEGRGMIEEINGKPLELDGMSCGAVRTLFRATVAMKKASNNGKGRTADDRDRTSAGMGVKGKVRTPAELNARMAELYKNA